MPSAKTGKKVITSITKAKKGDKVNVYFGKEKITLSLDTYTEYRLFVGKEVNESLLNSIKKKNNDEELYSYALGLASKFAYSTKDVEKKLEKKSDDSTQIWRIIYRIKDVGLLNDEEFAKQYKEEKEAAYYGSRRIKDDLLIQHGIKEEIVNALVFENEKDRAKEITPSLAKVYDKYPLKAKKEKVMNALMRRGYSQSDALYAVSGLKEDKEKSLKLLEKDATLTINKLKKRYSGYDLKERVYASLYAKGYKSDDISDVLRKESL